MAKSKRSIYTEMEIRGAWRILRRVIREDASDEEMLADMLEALARTGKSEWPRLENVATALYARINQEEPPPYVTEGGFQIASLARAYALVLSANTCINVAFHTKARLHYWKAGAYEAFRLYQCERERRQKDDEDA